MRSDSCRLRINYEPQSTFHFLLTVNPRCPSRKKRRGQSPHPLPRTATLHAPAGQSIDRQTDEWMGGGEAYIASYPATYSVPFSGEHRGPTGRVASCRCPSSKLNSSTVHKMTGCAMLISYIERARAGCYIVMGESLLYSSNWQGLQWLRACLIQ
jgi:hypothetical protein